MDLKIKYRGNRKTCFTDYKHSWKYPAIDDLGWGVSENLNMSHNNRSLRKKMDNATRIFFSIYMTLLIFGIINMLSWGGYFKANWLPNTLTLSTLEAGAILLNSIFMVVHRSIVIAKPII
ncbi:MAG: hypothetical protein ACP5OC_00670 [Thermoplasmata archaeon]